MHVSAAARVWVVSVGLALVAVGALAVGVLMTFVSGLTPPTDPLFAIVGLAASARGSR